MPRCLKTVLWLFAIIHILFGILIAWFMVRPDGIVLLAVMGFFLLAILRWGCLAVTLFFPSARSWRLKLIGQALVSAGFGYALRPMAFYLLRPAFESMVKKLQVNPNSDAWKRVAFDIHKTHSLGRPRRLR